MQRTQVMLEPWQHEILRTLAAARETSVSAVIREILTAYFQATQRKARKGIDDVAGVAEGPADLGVEHDAYLYGLGRGKSGTKKGAKKGKKTR